eukprot:5105382-Amphidinium_carterae.1
MQAAVNASKTGATAPSWSYKYLDSSTSAALPSKTNVSPAHTTLKNNLLVTAPDGIMRLHGVAQRRSKQYLL